MRNLALAAVLAFGTAAYAAPPPPPPPDTLPGTIHFNSGSSNVKARTGKKNKHVIRRTGNATMNKNALRDGTGKQ